MLRPASTDSALSRKVAPSKASPPSRTSFARPGARAPKTCVAVRPGAGGFMVTCVPRAPRAWPHCAQNRPWVAWAPQRGQVVWSSMGAPELAGASGAAGFAGGGGLKVRTPGAEEDGAAGEGFSAAGTNRVAAPVVGLWNERTTGAPGGGGPGCGGAGFSGTAATGGGVSKPPMDFPQAMQVFAPGSLYASQARQTIPRMPVSRPSSTSPPHAVQEVMVTSSFAPHFLHFMARPYPAATSALNCRTRSGSPSRMSVSPPASGCSGGGL